MNVDLASLRERDFRLLFVGQSISTVGDFVFPIALAFAVLESTGSAIDVGLVFGARSIVFVACVLLGGVVADRFSRRAVLLASDLVRFGTQASLAALVLTGHAELWHFLVLSAVYGAALAFFFPALTGILPAVVSPANLHGANALRSIAGSVAEIGGPALGGILVVLVSPGWAIGLDAATFGVGAIMLALLRPSRPPRHQRVARASILADLGEGWGEFRARTWVWSMTCVFAAGNALFAMTLVLGPVTSERLYGGAAAWATVLSAFGVGSLVGSLLTLHIRPARLLFTGVAVGWLGGLLPLALATDLPVALLAVSGLAAGGALIVVNTFWETSLQQHVPDAVLSRVSSYDHFGSLIAMPLGFAVAGPLSHVLGLTTTLALVGVLAIAVKLVPLAVPDVRNLRAAAEMST